MEIIALTNLQMIDKSRVDVDNEGIPIDSNILFFNGGNNKWHLAGISSEKFYIRGEEKLSFVTPDFNQIKNFLISLVGSNKISFAELINFKPEKGVIGPVCAKKLKHDFHDFKPLFKANEIESPVNFDKWNKAFSLASKEGVVIFA
jgi:hypothetical protein